MKKILAVLAVALVTFTACQKAEQAPVVYSVDDVYVQGDALVGDTILVEGTCMHLCVHGGKKAFLRSSEEGEIIRANAVDFESFAGECVNNTVRVRGVLRAMDVQAQPQEEEKKEGEEDCGICSTVRKYFLDAVSYDIIVAE